MLPRYARTGGWIFPVCRRRPIADRGLLQLWWLPGRQRGKRARRILKKRRRRRAPGDGFGGRLSALPEYPTVQDFYRKAVRAGGGSGNSSNSTEVSADP